MSTAYHPRTDGQSEVANKAIIQQIKQMVHEGDSNWLGQLPHNHSRLNRIRSSSRNATPYEITIGHYPRLIGDMSVKIQTQEERPTQRISRINQAQEIVRKRLQDAKISQAIQSNKRRRPAPEFSVGDQVLYPPRTYHWQRPTARSHQSGWDHSQSPPHIHRQTTIHYAFQTTLLESTLHSM